MTWDDFWAFYTGCESKENQKDLLAQVKLKSLLKNSSPRVQHEVLRDAPHKIMRSMRDILHEKAKRLLGYELQRSNNRTFS